MKPGITVAIPCIPPRAQVLRARAIPSIRAQTLRPVAVSLAMDTDHDGAAFTRQRALEGVETEWVAFLDDDDEMMPEHLERLYGCAQVTGADYVFSYYMVKDAAGNEWPGNDPLQAFGRPFDPKNPHQTTITTLVRTELAQAVGFKDPGGGMGPDRLYLGEDFMFTKGCVAAGAKIVHLPERTWWWWHWGFGTPGSLGNTSGLGHRW